MAERPGRRVLRVSCLLAAAALALLWFAATPAKAASRPRAVVNAMEFPWSAIGRVNAGGRGFCTGFLISERHVVTAAHCLYDAVTGRWRGAIELHFIAGYQREHFILHSKVVSYVRPKGLKFSTSATLATAANDWAILTLAEPIGRQAGWLGLKAIDSLMLSRITAGDVLLLQAGYRRDLQHVMTAGWSCHITGLAEGGRLLLHDCDVVPGESGSPLLLYADGHFYAVGLHTVELVTSSGLHRAGVLSFSIFNPNGGRRDAVDALVRTHAHWVPGHQPDAGSAAARIPISTIDSLLIKLGYLHQSAEPASVKARADALRRFRAENGLPSSGTPTVATMGNLLHAATP